MRLSSCLLITLFTTSCTEKDGEDTSEPTVYEVPCTSWATQDERGVLEIEIVQVEAAFPELGDCCDSWDGVWTAQLEGGELGRIYLSPIEYDLGAGVLRADFDGPVVACELALWRDDGS